MDSAQPPGPQLGIRAVGPFDAVKITWPGVEVQKLTSGQTVYDTDSRIFVHEGGTSVWRIDPCQVDPLTVTGKDKENRRKVHIEDRAPCNRDGIDFFLRLRVNTRNSNWGTEVSSILEMLAAAGDETDATMPPNVLDMALRIERLSQPAVARPVHTLYPLVLDSIRRVREQVNLALRKFREREKHAEMPFDELWQDLLSQHAQLSHITEEGLKAILSAEEIERKEASRAIDEIRAVLGPDKAQSAETHYWPKALPALVAHRLSAEDVQTAGLTPKDKRMLLTPLTFSEGDTLSLINVPETVALLVELADGSARWAEHARLEMRDGALVWSKHLDPLAEKVLASFLDDMPPLLQITAIDQGEADAPDWIAKAVRPSPLAEANWSVATGGDEKQTSAAEILGWLIDSTWPACVEFAATWACIDALVRSQNPLSDRIAGELSLVPSYDRALAALLDRLYVEAEPAGPPGSALLLAVGLHAEEGEAFLSALEAGDWSEARSAARRALDLETAPPGITLVTPE